jgi:glucose/arabinose dehydrogenase
MLVTEKIGPIWLVSAEGEKIAWLQGTPPVYWQGQNGMLGVFVSPRYATDQSVYITYIEPGDYGGGQALARGKLNLGRVPRLENLEVLWRQMPRGKGGQAGGQVAFAPDGNSLFMSVGDRQRMTPAQDPNQPEGKVLHLTLDGKPAPDNPNFGKTGAATIPLIHPVIPRLPKPRRWSVTIPFPDRIRRRPKPGPVAFARPMAWHFRLMVNYGRWSMARAAAMS